MDNSEKRKIKLQKELQKLKKQFDFSPWSLKKPLYLEKTDKRYKRHVKQLKKYGFSNAETWCLFSCISKFILPRLKAFKNVNMCHPGDISMEEWNEILDKMIFAFKWSITEDEEANYTLPDKEKEENWKKYEEGMNLFAKWYMGLWW